MTGPASPKGLNVRGRKMWRDLTRERTWDAAGLVLLAEACRLADRLEQMDELLRGDVAQWARIVDEYKSGQREIYVEVDATLTEARQMQTALLGILTKLGLGKSEAVKVSTGSRKDELAAKRAARVAAAAKAPTPA